MKLRSDAGRVRRPAGRRTPQPPTNRRASLLSSGPNQENRGPFREHAHIRSPDASYFDE